MENKEIECRFLNIDKEALVKKLLALGAKDEGEKFLEEIIIYDKDMKWRDGDKRLRLRTVDNKTVLSFKHHSAHTIDGTIEVEFGVDDPKAAELFLEQLGFVAYRHQQKKRHTLEYDGVTFDIDTWPRIPTYVELEGHSEAELKEAAKAVDLDWKKVEFHNPRWVIENIYKVPVGKMTWFTFDRFE